MTGTNKNRSSSPSAGKGNSSSARTPSPAKGRNISPTTTPHRNLRALALSSTHIVGDELITHNPLLEAENINNEVDVSNEIIFPARKKNNPTTTTAAATAAALLSPTTTTATNKKTSPSKREFNGLQGLQLDDLIQLRAAFKKADTSGDGALDINEFEGAFRSVCGDSVRDLNLLFMRIDANCDGTVSWDELLSYVFCQDEAAAEVTDAQGRSLFNNPPFPDNLYDVNGHLDSMFRIIPCSDINTGYLTISNDGQMLLWPPGNVSTQAQPLGFKLELPWITEAIQVETSRGGDLFAVGAADCSFAVVDVTAERFKIEGKLRLNQTPVSMAKWTGEDGVLYFAIGDEHGGVTIYPWKSMFRAAQDVLFQAEGKGLSSNSGVKTRRRGGALMSNQIKLKPHTDWVTQMTYAPDLKMLITSSSDGKIVFTDIEKNKVRHVLSGHRKGVNGFVWCSAHQFLASCGLERHVCIWQVTIKEPVFLLEGHQASVSSLLLHESADKLFSLDTERMIKIWDSRTYKCLQTIFGETYHPDFSLKAVYYCERRRVLLTGSRKLLEWTMAQQVVPKMHAAAVTAALYNDVFGLVVSADSEGSVRVWDVNSGEPVFRFRIAEGGTRITSLSFDATQRRLITATHDGAVKVWNFSTGELLRDLISQSHCEETVVCHLSNGNSSHFIAAGWSKAATLWPDIKDQPDIEVKPCQQLEGHKADILCGATEHPSTLVTGGSDGVMFVWNVESGFARGRCVLPHLEQRSSDARSIEQLAFIRTAARSLFVCCGGDGILYFWRTQGAKLAMVVKGGHEEGLPLTALAVDSDDGVLATGDPKGNIVVRNIIGMIQTRARPHPSFIETVSKFRAHNEALCSLNYIASRRLLLTSSSDCTVAMFSIDGAKFGTFGMNTTWKLTATERIFSKAAGSPPLFTPPEGMVIEERSQKKKFQFSGKGDTLVLASSLSSQKSDAKKEEKKTTFFNLTQVDSSDADEADDDRERAKKHKKHNKEKREKEEEEDEEERTGGGGGGKESITPLKLEKTFVPPPPRAHTVLGIHPSAEEPIGKKRGSMMVPRPMSEEPQLASIQRLTEEADNQMLFEVERIMQLKALKAQHGDGSDARYSSSGVNVAHRMLTKAITPIPTELPALEHRKKQRDRKPPRSDAVSSNNNNNNNNNANNNSVNNNTSILSNSNNTNNNNNSHLFSPSPSSKARDSPVLLSSLLRSPTPSGGEKFSQLMSPSMGGGGLAARLGAADKIRGMDGSGMKKKGRDDEVSFIRELQKLTLQHGDTPPPTSELEALVASTPTRAKQFYTRTLSRSPSKKSLDALLLSPKVFDRMIS